MYLLNPTFEMLLMLVFFFLFLSFKAEYIQFELSFHFPILVALLKQVKEPSLPYYLLRA